MVNGLLCMECYECVVTGNGHKSQLFHNIEDAAFRGAGVQNVDLGRVMIPMFAEQDDFNANFWATTDEVTQTKEFAIQSMSQWNALMKLMRSRPHRRDHQLPDIPNNPALLEEHIDIFKLWLSSFIAWGFSPDDLHRGFWAKSMKCRQRYAQEYLLDTERVVVVDIDGVLCDYRTGFCAWVRENRPQLLKTDNPEEWPKGYHDQRSFGLDLKSYQQLKHEFRVSGGKRTLPVVPGAKELLDHLRRARVTIALITSRPMAEYPSVWDDTVWWLNEHNLPFDALWFGQDKDEEILLQGIQDNVLFAIEDEPRHIQRLHEAGIDVMVPAHDYNEGIGDGVDNIYRQATLMDLNNLIFQLLPTYGVGVVDYGEPDGTD